MAVDFPAPAAATGGPQGNIRASTIRDSFSSRNSLIFKFFQIFRSWKRTNDESSWFDVSWRKKQAIWSHMKHQYKLHISSRPGRDMATRHQRFVTNLVVSCCSFIGLFDRSRISETSKLFIGRLYFLRKRRSWGPWSLDSFDAFFMPVVMECLGPTSFPWCLLNFWCSWEGI